MSVKNRFMFSMLIIAVIAATITLISNVMQFSWFVDRNIENELNQAVFKIENEIEEMIMKSQLVMLYFANDSEFRSAMIQGDYTTARRRAVEMYEQVDVETLSVINTDYIVVVRCHNPAVFGDTTAGMEMARANIEDQVFMSGLVPGIETLALRTSAGIFDDDGNIVGALSSGDRLDTNRFVDKLKKFTGCEISVYVGEYRVATTLLNDDGTRAVNDKERGIVHSIELLHLGESLEIIRHINQDLMTIQVPLYSAVEGELAAIVSVGIFLTDKQEMVSSFVFTSLLIAAIFFAAMIIIISLFSKRISVPIDMEISKIYFDKLTGLYNRRYFDVNMERLLQSLSRSNGTFSLLVLDIDFFKKYNDTYGHIKGDECLQIIAQALKDTLNRADDFVARYGGEEFAVVLPNTDEDGARQMAEKIFENIRNCRIPHEKNEASEFVSVSIGVTTGTAAHTQQVKDYISQADRLLYESKQNGRNRYTFGRIN